MKSRILLVNFDRFEQEKISLLGIEVDLGYISDILGDFVSFMSPLAPYEYKAIFIRLTRKPILDVLFKDKAKNISEKDSVDFLNYWRKKGILTIFLEANSFKSLKKLGIPYVTLIDANPNDMTVEYVLDDKGKPFREVFRLEKSSVVMPPSKYIEVEKRQGPYEEGNWTIRDIYRNLNDAPIGAYFNAQPYYTDEDAPCFIVLPPFKEYTGIVTKLLKSFAKLYPGHFPEVYEEDWVQSDKYFPKSVSHFDMQIDVLRESTKKKIQELEIAKNQEKDKYSFVRAILHELGDELKNAVIKVLREIWQLNVEDVDETRKTELKEDILIRDNEMIVLGEIKGTQDQNPTNKYFSQLLIHIGKSEYKNAIGALILNHDLKKEPDERNYAYKNDEDLLEDMIYIDTRVLFYLTLAIIDWGMSPEEAKKILLKKGRVAFDLNKYIKGKSIREG